MEMGESSKKYPHDDQKQLLDDDDDDGDDHDHQVEGASATATSSSSSWRIRRSTGSTSSLLIDNLVDEESDEDLFTVPDVEARPPAESAATATATTVVNNYTSTYNNKNTNYNNNPEVQSTAATRNIKRHRGRNPADKEYRRLKSRLLRNRVSAQQARERKKVYVNDLESRAKELQEINTKLEEKISTLINENTMLRKVLMNTRPKVDESTEQVQ
ncbi:unnamed protein product [Dovyalis caffra]|uniref:BZIP domain-containing protein n=1 Tax=Dovyalis caffra TaxID=77055 RepID=A0AAV1R3D9_9ROSI|nr:unnamed protein product [Dovyalis caffra]